MMMIMMGGGGADRWRWKWPERGCGAIKLIGETVLADRSKESGGISKESKGGGKWRYVVYMTKGALSGYYGIRGKSLERVKEAMRGGKMGTIALSHEDLVPRQKK